MNRKRMILAGALLVLCVAAGAYGYSRKKAREVIVLELGMFTGSNWDVANANSYIILDKAIERFERDHENVRVNYVSGIRKEDYSEWLSQKILTGETPDVFMVLTSDFNQFASIGVLKNLEEISAADTEFEAEDYFTTALNSGKYQGSQYAMPYETVPTLMFVNKTLLAREGIEVPGNDWTWEDMKTICEQVTKDTDGDGIPDQFGTYNYSWKDAVYSNDGSLFDTDGTRGLFTEKDVLRAVEFTKEIYELNQGQKVTQEDFDEGRVAFMPLVFAEYRTYKTYPYRLKKYSTFQWDCITMPAGEQGDNVSEVDTLLLGISNNTKQEALAWEFLKYLSYDEETQMDIFHYSQGASVLKNVTSSETAAEILMEDMEESEKVIDNELLSQVIEDGAIAPKFQKYEEALALADSEVSGILENDRNIESSLKIFQHTITKYLSQ